MPPSGDVLTQNVIERRNADTWLAAGQPNAKARTKMDHVGDMLRYLHAGLESQGYTGISSWNGLDLYRESPTAHSDEWEITDRNHGRAIMHAKDNSFLVTVEVIDHACLPD